MFTCPACQTQLIRKQTHIGLFWGCRQCRGRTATLAVLRKHLDAAFLRSLWDAARDPTNRGARPCPACALPMATVHPSGGAHELDVCRACHLVWFDPREFAAVPEAAPEEAAGEPELPIEARELIARANLDRVTRETREKLHDPQEPPDAWWKYGLALMGVPVEADARPTERMPMLTWAVAGVIGLVAFLTFRNLEAIVYAYGFLPADPWRHGGLTIVASFFLHGGIVHVLGNLYFLIVFGDNVEDYLGKGWYAVLLIAAALAGTALHAAFDPRGDLPSIGASGGISGLVMFYACAFPNARMGIFFWFYVIPRWISLSAKWFVLLWFFLQVIGASLQLGGLGNVSALAHLGGAAVGLVFWIAKGR